ncbi:GPI transamidase subunit PIG-U [Mesonia phycicola]|uniref:GPI transamidase subunit PIG-U n=2 Tax=Mesonia phycicola TaxID=579105 RepID=A0A1M6H227_9FLAO|nr:GPI transamidase subunit PIG-U [Mesonia phycicola]
MLVTMLVLYYVFAYNLLRSDFVKLITLYAALFFLSYKTLQLYKFNWKYLLALGVLFRLVFLVAIPNLSQDFYRFIWDGRLFVQGLNPYMSTPQQWIDAGNFGIVNQSLELVEGMQSLNASHYTNYPPVAQFIYVFTAFISPNSILGSVVVMRLILIIADVVSFIFLRKLLLKLNIDNQRAFWYFLNPLVIIELTGNLHFEGVMVMFLVISLYLLLQKKWCLSAILLGLSISVKLLPLMLLPLFLQYFRKQEKLSFYKLLFFYFLVLLTVIISFSPFASVEFINNFASSIVLWFSKFEFNASVYYLIRWVGFQTVGWNIIGTVGKILPLVIIMFIIGLALFCNNTSEKKLYTSMLFAFALYFLLSTTVHPWYLITPLAISIFTKYRFMLMWSFTVIFSYSAYETTSFNEQLWLVSLEYFIVLLSFLYDAYRIRFQTRVRIFRH